MKKLLIAALFVGFGGVANAQYQLSPTWINPQPGGGAIITQPGSTPYQPPVYVNPMPGGGYMMTQPGAQPYQPPTYANPMPGGGYMLTQPGAPYQPFEH